MIDNYNRFFGYTVDRGAIDAWNEYLMENKLIPHAVKAADVIYAGRAQALSAAAPTAPTAS